MIRHTSILRFITRVSHKPGPLRRPFVSQKGSALMMAIIFMLVATTLITVGVKLISDASRSAKEKELYVGEAENVAKAGLIDALGWFRRQGGNGGIVEAYDQPNYIPGQTPNFLPGITYVDQPFSPVNNVTNAQSSDTIDASIGIVAEYPLNSPVTSTALYWARYEVKKQGAGAYDPDAVHDISGQRTGFVNGDGAVWYLQATGYVYKRLDKTVDVNGYWIVPYNVSPNLVIAKAKMATELRKLSLNMPVPNPPGPNNVSAGLYAENVKNQVTLTSSQCLLFGAVSQVGSYAAIGETSP